MPHYRRAHALGATYFFTVVTHERQPILNRPDALDALRDAIRSVKKAKPFELDAIVILPDHLHAIWTLPENDAEFSARWGMIKRQVSKAMPSSDRSLTSSWRKRRELGLWQRRFWEHLIRDEEDYARHMDYIHYNPVKHGYVGRPGDWPYSSFKKCVDKGLYPADWASGADIDGAFGE